jgi:hypothetical protein
MAAAAAAAAAAWIFFDPLFHFLHFFLHNNMKLIDLAVVDFTLGSPLRSITT